MVALEQLKRIREMAINKMNEIIRVAEGRLESREDGFLEEPKEETRAEETVEVPSEPKATRPRRGEKGGVNKSALIRAYFDKHKDAKNSEVIAYMKKAHNIEVKPSLVSTVKIETAKKGGRPKAETKAKGKRGRKPRGGLPMVACVTRVLSKSKSKQGARAEDILAGVKKLGYVYSGDKGDAGFLNCVYQALHDLCKEKDHAGWKGSGPVLLHDKETHTWKLNPRAERKTA